MQSRLGYWTVKAVMPCTLAGTALWAWDRSYGARVLSRNGRALWGAGRLAFDYKWNFQADRSAEELSALHQRAAERILDVCQKNGGLYTKFGQALALQSAVLPPEYNKVMKVLLDDAPFSSYDEVERIIREELGDVPEKLFCTFDRLPIASASIAQVHQATLNDGTRVAVKVQKPEIQRQIEWDLRAHTLLMKFFEWTFDLPITWAGEFVQEHLRQEIDFAREGRNAEMCAQAIASEPKLREEVYVPRVFWDYSADRVLTCEWIDGRRLADIDELRAMNYDMTEIMRIMVDLFSHQIFITGFVHCDPHPGNLLVRPHPSGPPRRPQLVLLDHGLYLRCRDSFRREHCQLWKSLFTNDHRRLTEICHQWGIKEVGMFASATLMRPYQQGQSAATLNAPIRAHDVYEMQLQAKKRARDLLINEQQFPRELILVGRNMNMIRAYNQALGSPVNRIGRMADWAARGLGTDWTEWPTSTQSDSNSNESTTNGPAISPAYSRVIGQRREENMLQYIISGTRARLAYIHFRLTMALINISFVAMRLWQHICSWFLGQNVQGFEDALDAQANMAMQKEFGISVDMSAFNA